MRPFNLNKKSYHCGGCGTTYLEEPIERRRLDGDQESGTWEEDVSWETVWCCHDGYYDDSWNPCVEYYRDNFSLYDEAWECGNCNRVHGDLGSAMRCCA